MDIKENLTEAKLDYSTQKRKMAELNNGAYKNISAMSDEKLIFNRQVCQNEGFIRALKAIEYEMVVRGLISPQPTPTIQPTPQVITTAFLLDLTDFDAIDGELVISAQDTQPIIGNALTSSGPLLKHLLKSLILAICLKKPAGFIEALKLYIVNQCKYPENLIKETIKNCLSNPDIVKKLNKISTMLLTEDLEEAKKKKKKVANSISITTGDIAYNIAQFNKRMGTDFPGNDNNNPSTEEAKAAAAAANNAIADGVNAGTSTANSGNSTNSSDNSTNSSGESTGNAGEGGAMGESLKEDTTKELQIQNNENIEKDIEELEPPIDPEYFPNNMGINLSSVKKETWVQQDDGQLKTVAVEFDPATEEEKVKESLEDNFWAERDADKNTYKVDGDEVDAKELVDIIYDCIHSFDKDEDLNLSQESIDHCARDTYRAYIELENKKEIGELVSDWLELTESLEGVNMEINENFKDLEKRALARGLVEVKVANLEKLDPAAALKCEMAIEDDNGISHFYAKPEVAANLEKFYNKVESLEEDIKDMPTNIVDMLDALWQDEEEAISGYEQAIDKIDSKVTKLSDERDALDELINSEDEPKKEDLDRLDNLDDSIDALENLMDIFDHISYEEEEHKDELDNAKDNITTAGLDELNLKEGVEESLEATVDQDLEDDRTPVDNHEDEFAEPLSSDEMRKHEAGIIEEDYKYHYFCDPSKLEGTVWANSRDEAYGKVELELAEHGYYVPDEIISLEDEIVECFKEDIDLDEAKRDVKRYYIRPQNIYCSNKTEIIKNLIKLEDQNCSIYTLKNLPDNKDLHLLTNKDIIYYYDDGILYDKNHVKVMDYDLYIKHEEDRKKFPGDADNVPEATFADEYDDRITDANLNMEEDLMLDEDKIYVGKLGGELELPSDIHLISKQEVEDRIELLEPEEEFEVGYVNPIYLYKELWEVMPIYKCTEMKGYTGVDFAPSEDKVNTDKAQRIKDAKDQIKQAKETGTTFEVGSTVDYTSQNKLVKRDAIMQGGQVIGHHNTILFYPTSSAKVCYYVKLPTQPDFIKLNAEQLEKHIYDNLNVIKRKLTPEQVNKKIQTTLYGESDIDIDRATRGDSTLDPKFIQKYGRDKHSVRALYTTQIYYLSIYNTNILGHKLVESLSEDLELKENSTTGFSGYFVFDDQAKEAEFNTKWAKSLNGENEKIKGVQDAKISIQFKDGNRFKEANYGTILGFSVGNKTGKLLVHMKKHGTGDKVLTYNAAAFFDPQKMTGKDGREIIYCITTKDSQLRSRLEVYLTDKKDRKAEMRTAAFRGARSVESLTPEERAEALAWFAEHIKSINITYPTGTPSYTAEEGELDSSDPKVKAFGTKFALIDKKFHRDFEIPAGETEGFLDTAHKVHFMARDAEIEHEKTLNYYNFWGLACTIDFNTSLKNANSVVLGLIDQAKKDTITAHNEANEWQETDTSISSIFLCFSIKTLVEDDWNKLSLTYKALDQDFPSVDNDGEIIENLKESAEKHFTCCICGEESEGYGNNPAPVKEEGKCCDACNRKFVIPARLELLTAKENNIDEE